MSYKVGVYRSTFIKKNKKLRDQFKCFAEGISRQGDVSFLEDKLSYSNCDAAAIFGMVKYQKKYQKNMHDFKQLIIDKHFKNNSLLVFDNPIFRIVGDPFLNSSDYLRLGLNSFLFDEAEFANENSPPDRWNLLSKSLNIERKKYRKNGNHILLVIQKLFDASLRGPEDQRPYAHISWINKAISDIRSCSDRKIIVKAHPLSLKIEKELKFLKKLNFDSYKNVEFDLNSDKNIKILLKDAWACVTYCSGSAAISLLEGIPVVAYDSGSMAWPVADKDAKDIENINIYDINQWLYNLAYTQWNSEELKTGIPWARLRPHIEKVSKNV